MTACRYEPDPATAAYAQAANPKSKISVSHDFEVSFLLTQPTPLIVYAPTSVSSKATLLKKHRKVALEKH